MRLTLKVQTNTLINVLKLDSNDTITIGRTNKSDVEIADPLLSGVHCKIHYKPPFLQITDIKSKNGTYLNGVRIEQSDFYVGDEVIIGNTKITILTEKMESKAISELSFPGDAKDRQAHVIQLDYAGAGMVPQGFAGLPGADKNSTGAPVRKEHESRQAQSKTKLTKQEIKIRNKRASSQAKTFDTIFFLAALAAPLFILNIILILTPALLKNHRLILLIAVEIISAIIFYVINFKVLKFTLGEKVAGIQSIYEDQEV